MRNLTRLARQLWFQVLVAMAAGAVLGYARPDLGTRMQPLGDASSTSCA